MNSVDAPLVSVLMPVYNGDKYLQEAIESILNQTYVNFELIIINDGSTDASEEIILSYSDDRIVYFKNERNLKLIQTLNLGISISKGKYIARMDADDISLPMRFEKQVHFLEKNQDIGVLGTGVFLKTDKETSQLLYHTDDASIRFALAFYCPFIHPTIMLRKTIVDELPIVFDLNYVHAEDYELWTRLAFFTKMANLPEYLLDYRVHDSQISSQHSLHQTEISNTIRKKYLKNYFGEETEEYLFVFKLVDSEQSLSNKLQTVKKLYRLNKNRSIFEGGNLNRYLIKLWKDLFLDAQKITIKSYFYLISNVITYKSKWSFKQFVSVLVKLFKLFIIIVLFD